MLFASKLCLTLNIMKCFGHKVNTICIPLWIKFISIFSVSFYHWIPSSNRINIYAMIEIFANCQPLITIVNRIRGLMNWISFFNALIDSTDCLLTNNSNACDVIPLWGILQCSDCAKTPIDATTDAVVIAMTGLWLNTTQTAMAWDCVWDTIRSSDEVMATKTLIWCLKEWKIFSISFIFKFLMLFVEIFMGNMKK